MVGKVSATQVAQQQLFAIPKSYPLAWLAQSIASVVLFLPRLLTGRMFCPIRRPSDDAWKATIVARDAIIPAPEKIWTLDQLPGSLGFLLQGLDGTEEFNCLLRTCETTKEEGARIAHFLDNPQEVKAIDLRGVTFEGLNWGAQDLKTHFQHAMFIE